MQSNTEGSVFLDMWSEALKVPCPAEVCSLILTLALIQLLDESKVKGGQIADFQSWQ